MKIAAHTNSSAVMNNVMVMSRNIGIAEVDMLRRYRCVDGAQQRKHFCVMPFKVKMNEDAVRFIVSAEPNCKAETVNRSVVVLSRSAEIPNRTLAVWFATAAVRFGTTAIATRKGRNAEPRSRNAELLRRSAVSQNGNALRLGGSIEPDSGNAGRFCCNAEPAGCCVVRHSGNFESKN